MFSLSETGQELWLNGEAREGAHAISWSQGFGFEPRI